MTKRIFYESTYTPPKGCADAVHATIKWVPGDIMTLRPGLSQEEASEALDRIRKSLIDRSIEVGWDIMEDLLGEEGREESDDS